MDLPQFGNPAGLSIAPGTYLPQQSFNQLIGSHSMEIGITVVDNLPIDNGYIFSWGINFDSTYYLQISPLHQILFHLFGLMTRPSQTSMEIQLVFYLTAMGSIVILKVLDNFGCQYSEEICIEVLPELIYDQPNDLFICDPGSAPYVFDLSLNEDVVLASNPNPSDFVLTFHNLVEDAENDVNAIINLNSYEGNDQETVYIRVEYLDSNC